MNLNIFGSFWSSSFLFEICLVGKYLLESGLFFASFDLVVMMGSLEGSSHRHQKLNPLFWQDWSLDRNWLTAGLRSKKRLALSSTSRMSLMSVVMEKIALISSRLVTEMDHTWVNWYHERTPDAKHFYMRDNMNHLWSSNSILGISKHLSILKS